MAGTYSVGETKPRPGVYHRRYSVGGGELAGALNGVGMGIIRANWGPLNKAVAFEPSTNVNAVFGNGNTEDLITEMFPAVFPAAISCAAAPAARRPPSP